MEALLLRVVPGLSEEWQGATPDEIERIEQLAGRPLPPFYRWFLSRMGKSMGKLTYPGLDFSASRVLTCYAEKRITPEPRFLFIAYNSDETMPLHVFYDLEAPARADALVTWGDTWGNVLHEGFETLREMLAWGAVLSFRVGKMPQQCEGIITGEPVGFLSRFDSVMSRLGFTQPVPTGPYCRLYERPDAAMVCSSPSAATFKGGQAFTLGGVDEGALRRILGEIATEPSLEVEVDEWMPELG
ncbi:SMI1/KNR4 family protein [Pyxidicoccus fallax]|uniref:SMI1/KNR4 family protein n=1 Tax=Pyxidicoccus fallax TaxID=394095 RepID=A0A848LSX1_9BACT|nr:SMI1/KNR4 family protein [Pyxidicoccus fallax]NMO21035.1 SMI1/KNR4 family protein [Pyxidicoccus fallax]NPC80398.1 SMI1/KNR4 family protein [Pyxidicoccus fallax]